MSARRLDRVVQPPAAGGKPRSLVVALHRLGSAGAEIAEIVAGWAPLLPHTAFISPTAPQPYDPDPAIGFQWFSMQDRTLSGLRASVAAGAPALDGFLDEILAEHGLDESRMALLGFSQGGMIALHVGLRRPKAPAAIVGLSTMMLAGPEIAGQIRARPPVLLVHGDLDAAVPVGAFEATAAMLRALGVAVETDLRPGLGHWFDSDGLARSARFLTAALNRD